MGFELPSAASRGPVSILNTGDSVHSQRPQSSSSSPSSSPPSSSFIARKDPPSHLHIPASIASDALLSDNSSGSSSVSIRSRATLTSSSTGSTGLSSELDTPKTAPDYFVGKGKLVAAAGSIQPPPRPPSAADLKDASASPIRISYESVGDKNAPTDSLVRKRGLTAAKEDEQGLTDAQRYHEQRRRLPFASRSGTDSLAHSSSGSSSPSPAAPAHLLLGQSPSGSSSDAGSSSRPDLNMAPKRMTSQSCRKRYPCNHHGCGKNFSTSGHAARHARIHTGDKPYKCTFPGCAASFSRQDNALAHFKTGHAVTKARSTGSEVANGTSPPLMASSAPAGSSDQLEADPSVEMGRRALEEGTAIAVVRGGKIERTVGLPNTGRTVAAPTFEDGSAANGSREFAAYPPPRTGPTPASEYAKSRSDLPATSQFAFGSASGHRPLDYNAGLYDHPRRTTLPPAASSSSSSSSASSSSSSVPFGGPGLRSHPYAKPLPTMPYPQYGGLAARPYRGSLGSSSSSTSSEWGLSSGLRRHHIDTSSGRTSSDRSGESGESDSTKVNGSHYRQTGAPGSYSHSATGAAPPRLSVPIGEGPFSTSPSPSYSPSNSTMGRGSSARRGSGGSGPSIHYSPFPPFATQPSHTSSGYGSSVYHAAGSSRTVAPLPSASPLGSIGGSRRRSWLPGLLSEGPISNGPPPTGSTSTESAQSNQASYNNSTATTTTTSSSSSEVASPVPGFGATGAGMGIPLSSSRDSPPGGGGVNGLKSSGSGSSIKFRGPGGSIVLPPLKLPSA